MVAKRDVAGLRQTCRSNRGFRNQSVPANCQPGAALPAFFSATAATHRLLPNSRYSLVKGTAPLLHALQHGSMNYHFARQSHNTPRKLELGTSEWSLTGTGNTSTSKTPKAKKDTAVRSRPTKTRITYNAVDRFIPNRTASEGLCNVGTSKLDLDQRPKSSSKTEGSSVLANAASAFDLGGQGRQVRALGLMGCGVGPVR